MRSLISSFLWAFVALWLLGAEAKAPAKKAQSPAKGAKASVRRARPSAKRGIAKASGAKATKAKAPAKKAQSPAKGAKASIRRARPSAKRGIALPSLPRYGPKTLALTALFRRARRHNPSLKRLRRWVAVYKQRERQAGAWPDLRFSVSGTNFPMPSFNPTQTAMSGIVYSVSQQFPILGRLRARKVLARLNTQGIEALVRERESQLYFELQKALHQLRLVHRSLALQRELHQIMGQAAAVARTRYTVGKAPQQHHLQALTSQALIRSRMFTLLARERSLRHRLARLLGRSSFRSRLPARLPVASALKLKAVLQKAGGRGLVLRWKLAARQAQKLLSWARLRYWPRVTLQISVRQRFRNPVDDGNPFLSVGLKIPIPSWGNGARHGLVREAMARHQLARSRLRESLSRIREDAKVALTTLRSLDQKAQIIRQQTIPLAGQSYRSALGQYQVGKVRFVALTNAIGTLFKERFKLDQIRARRAILRSRLHALSGFVPQ